MLWAGRPLVPGVAGEARNRSAMEAGGAEEPDRPQGRRERVPRSTREWRAREDVPTVRFLSSLCWSGCGPVNWICVFSYI